MKLSKKTKKNLIIITKLFVIPILSLVIVIALTAYFLFPRASQIQELLDKKNKEEKTLKNLETKLAKLKEINANELNENYTIIENILPSKKDIPLILSSLNQLQDQTGVNVDSISLQPGLLELLEELEVNKEEVIIPGGLPTVIEENKTQEVSYDISISGSKESVISFIDKLLASSPLTNINNLSLDEVYGQTRVLLYLTTFYMNLPKSLGTIDKPLTAYNDDLKGVFESVGNYTIYKIVPDNINISSSSASPKKDQSIFTF